MILWFHKSQMLHFKLQAYMHNGISEKYREVGNLIVLQYN